MNAPTPPMIAPRFFDDRQLHSRYWPTQHTTSHSLKIPVEPGELSLRDSACAKHVHSIGSSDVAAAVTQQYTSLCALRSHVLAALCPLASNVFSVTITR